MTQLCSCGEPTAGAWLCDRCVKTLRHAIANVAVYHDDLGTIARRQARYGDQGPNKGSIGKAQPLPVDLRFVNGAPRRPIDQDTGRRIVGGPVTASGNQLRWDTWQTLTVWTRTIAEAQQRPAGPACGDACLHVSCAAVRIGALKPGDTVPAMSYYLARHLRWVLKQTWVPQLLEELLDLERRLRRFVDRPPDRWYAGRCGSRSLLEPDKVCEAELYAEVGRSTIKCPGCETQHDVAGRRDFLLNAARDYLVTATQAAGALMSWTDYDGTERNLIGRISKWQERGRVQAKGTEKVGGRDCHLYRLGDLQDRLVTEAQRQQERRLRTG